jgi:hypothetical protein
MTDVKVIKQSKQKENIFHVLVESVTPTLSPGIRTRGFYSLLSGNSCRERRCVQGKSKFLLEKEPLYASKMEGKKRCLMLSFSEQKIEVGKSSSSPNDDYDGDSIVL